MDVSEFYLACHAGDLSTLKWLLPTFPLAAIDQFEPNGSTALHAASSNGHIEIVSLLLEKGAARQQLDIFGVTPYEEAKTSDIEKLFERPENNGHDRFIAHNSATEWTLTEWEHGAVHNCTVYANGETPDIGAVISKIETAEQLQGGVRMEQITNFLQQAIERNDSAYLLRAYTAETDFYKQLNVTLASQKRNENRFFISNDPPWYMAFPRYLFREHSLTKYHWKGITYRGMRMTENDLDQYMVGKKLMNKAFLSTSQLRSVAERFLSRGLSSSTQPVICRYKIGDSQIAFDLQTISEYPNEQEVLVIPGITFKVNKIDHSGNTIEIELEQELEYGMLMGRQTFTTVGPGNFTVTFTNNSENTLK